MREGGVRAFTRFIGLDVHEATTSICVRDRTGAIITEAVIPTTASALRRFFPNRRSTWCVAYEESTLAQWLYELLLGRVGRITVCNPRYHRLIGNGEKSDRIDASRLAELLRVNGLRSVHHCAKRVAIREFVRHYDTLVGDATRIMYRIRAIYRQHGIPASGMTAYSTRGRKAWLRRTRDATTRKRLLSLYTLLDMIVQLRDTARIDMVTEALRHDSYALLRSVPYVGEIRGAQLLALIGTRSYPSFRHLSSYAGFAVVVYTSSDHVVAHGRLARRPPLTRGLTRNFNPRLKRVLKDVAVAASRGRGPFRRIYDRYVSGGLHERVARVALARKIASIIYAILRDQKPFDLARLHNHEPVPGTGSEQQQSPLPIEARA
jgi:transposase